MLVYPFASSHMISIPTSFDTISWLFSVQSELLISNTFTFRLQTPRHEFVHDPKHRRSSHPKVNHQLLASINNGNISQPLQGHPFSVSPLPQNDTDASCRPPPQPSRRYYHPVSPQCPMQRRTLLPPSWILADVTTWRRRHLPTPRPRELE